MELLDGRFRIIGPIASGGMATVYLAHDAHTNTEVAIKFPELEEPSLAARFEREATILATLSHPGIVRYIGSGRADDGRRWIACELVSGDTLLEKLARDGLTLHQTVRLALRIGETLDYAARHEIVHRDLKPSNLLLPDGDVDRVKLIDFGVARRRREPVSLTSTGALVGSPGYMSPEQVTTARTVDARADLFSLGCILYECITGVPAFRSEHLASLMAKILLTEPARIGRLRPEAPAELVTIVERLLEKDLRARPRDAAEVVAAFRALRIDDAAAIARAAGDVATAVTDENVIASSLVLAGFPDEEGPTEATGDIPTLVSGDRLERLANGMTVVAVHGDELAERATRAAIYARSLRATNPRVPIYVATIRAELAAAIELGMRALRTAAMAELFGTGDARREPGAIGIDALTASLLGDEAQKDRAGFYLSSSGA